MTNNLTQDSFNLFIALAEDAANWMGQPLIDITKEQRGNLTDLKRKNLLTTFCDEGCEWASFTAEGIALAAANNIEI
jgi:hypothetical protein